MRKDRSVDDLIVELLLKDGNETNFIEDEEVYDKFLELIKVLSKIKYNIRWCGLEKCICHAERQLMFLLKNDRLMGFIIEYTDIDIEDFKKLIDNYNPITVYDMRYLK